MNTLYYQNPPESWLEGLPLGNGRIACMVSGADSDCLTLNHEWLWTGLHRNRQTDISADGLETVRQYIRDGDLAQATALGNELFGGKGGMSGIPGRVDDYQPAGVFCMRPAGDWTYLSRELDLRTGIAVIRRERSRTDETADGKAELRTEVFVDCRNGALMACWETGEAFDAEMTLTREAEEGTNLTYTASADGFRMDGEITGGIRFAVQVTVQTDGTMQKPDGGRAVITGATYIRCAVQMATDRTDLEAELQAHAGHPEEYAAVRAKHGTAFAAQMDTVELALCAPEQQTNPREIPTDVRVRQIREGHPDPEMSALYFDYGRYLLVSSSICGELPANLQGKWNDSLKPAWNCDYHFDINLEMNYWPAEPTGLSTCVEALIRYVRSFIPSGQEAARRLYGCRGLYLPIQTDAWGCSTPESTGWAVWIGAAPWIARHLWDHYRYTGDKTYLREQAYEVFRLIADFYEDYLVQDENGIYQILPSQSPENRIRETGPYPVLLDQSSAMDVQLCYDSLGYAVQTAKILGVDADRAAYWQEIREHLPPFAIGSDGRLMEWRKEYEEVEPGHRHYSHLYGLYPSDLFTPDTRPEQYAACRRSLEARLAGGGGHTGWSRAWTACLYARLGEPEEFYRHYTALMQDFATVSLLNLHPPRIFQIEGNFGGTAAVIEAIVSFYDDTAHLLRSLPDAWHTGHLYGVHIPGGHVLHLAWENGCLTEGTITIGYSGKARLSWKNSRGQTAERLFTGTPGTVIRID